MHSMSQSMALEVSAEESEVESEALEATDQHLVSEESVVVLSQTQTVRMSVLLRASVPVAEKGAAALAGINFDDPV